MQFDISSTIVDELKRLQEIFKPNIIGSSPKDFHLTLKFLGDINSIENVSESLRKIKVEKFGLRLNGLGVFPNMNYIRVLWVGINKSEKLIKLKNNIETALKPFCFKNDYDYMPHLTFARIRNLKDKESFEKKLEKTKVKQIEFDVNSFILYKSTLTSNGTVYEKIHEFFSV